MITPPAHNRRFGNMAGRRIYSQLFVRQSALVPSDESLYSADGTLLSISNNNEHFIINLASVPGRRLVNSPTAQSLDRYASPLVNLQAYENHYMELQYGF